uniref:AAA family ATPase n=1 Tax=Sphingobacterium sp. (strain 21) TaxID=743722 RepID=F4C508_SPHS2
MLAQSTIEDVINAQRESLVQMDPGLYREALKILPDLSTHALIVSGIRRSGKSTLLFQLLKKKYNDALYLNFEDPRLYEFELGDFVRLDAIIKASSSQVLLFDELQVIPDWERYIRQKLDEQYKVVITGSNASLLSKELGTKLTGRHISKELFPFSYTEFASFNNLQANTDSVHQYLTIGGFPAYVKTRQAENLQQLFDDILIRDIAVRYGVRDVKSLQRLAQYLISNVSKPISANRLKTLFELGSTNTISEYLAHMEYAYLMYFVPKFSYSQRKQLVNPRKVYAIDTGMINLVSTAFTEDQGRKFENLIYMHLRRKHKEIYYFSERGECDFIVFNRGTFQQAVQVCWQLNQDNLNRELNGLFEALTFFDEKEGALVTLEQNDRFEKEGKVIQVMPAHEFLQK